MIQELLLVFSWDIAVTIILSGDLAIFDSPEPGASTTEPVAEVSNRRDDRD